MMLQMESTAYFNLKKNLSKYIQVTTETWELLYPLLTIKKIKKNDIIIKAGDICQSIYYINTGIIRFFYYSTHAEITSCFNFQDSFITSLSSCILQKPSFENAQALTEAEVVAINYSELLNLYNKSHTIERIGRLIVENAYIELEDRMFSNYHNNAETKYLNLLKNGHPDIIKKIPLKQIASYLGVTPETISRIRNKNLRLIS